MVQQGSSQDWDCPTACAYSCARQLDCASIFAVPQWTRAFWHTIEGGAPTLLLVEALDP